MGQNLISYEFNPYYFAEKPEYRSLTFTERGVYREVMDLCWQTEKKSSMKYCPSDLAEKLGISEAEADAAVTKLCDESGLLELTFDLSSESMTISSPYLEKQIKTLTNRESRMRVIAVEQSMKEDNTVTPLKRVSGHRDAYDPIVGYLTEKEVVSGSDYYSGWLPTAKFTECGQVYYVRKGVIQTLRSNYPGRNIEDDLTAMFNHLIKEDSFRPTLPAINRYIASWIQRNESGEFKPVMSADNIDEAFDSLDDDFSKLIESGNL